MKKGKQPLFGDKKFESAKEMLYGRNSSRETRKKGLDLLKRLGEDGHLESQLLLGDIYGQGKYVAKDLRESLEWNKRAALQGDKGAQFSTAQIYRLTNQHEEAFEFYKIAAQNGHVEAMNSLGTCYLKGRGVEVDYQKALECYEEAAKWGSMYAQCNAAEMYRTGKEVEKNHKRAYELYIKSANQGFATAQHRLAMIYDSGEIVAKDKEKAIRLCRMSAEQGYVEAQYMLGEYYYDGDGVEVDYGKAFNLFEKAAQQDHRAAQYMLGECYYWGNGVEEDDEEAFYWYEKSANQGYVKAQIELAEWYEEGRNFIDDDIDMALEWYEKAADQGDEDAQDKIVDIAESYLYGKDREKDTGKAFLLYKKYAEKGHAKAQNALGICYQKGWGVEPDNTQALTWYKKSAEQDYASAHWNIALLYERGELVEKNLSEAFKWFQNAAKLRIEDYKEKNKLGQYYENGWGVEVNYKNALECYEDAAEQGFDDAQYNAARLYESGVAGEKNLKKAFDWYKRAADKGHKDAQYSAALLYYSGKTGERNLKKASELFEKVAEQGHREAQLYLGCCYYGGIGVETDKNKAFKWYEKSAQMGNAQAQYYVANLYFNGEIGEKNLEDAFIWYEKAANQGFDKAQNMLGRCYQNGWGVDVNYKEALGWYEKAAEQGYANAQYNMARLLWSGKAGERNLEKALSLLKKAMECEEFKNVPTNLNYACDVVASLGKDFEHSTDGASLEKAIESYKILHDCSVEKYKVLGLDNLVRLEKASPDYTLANAYRVGSHVPKDEAKAFDYLIKAANSGDACAQLVKGCLSMGEQLNLVDYSKELQGWKKFNDDLKEKEEGVTENASGAFYIFEDLAKQGVADAYVCLAICHHNAIGTTRGEELALSYLNQFKAKAEAGRMFDSQTVASYMNRIKDSALDQYLDAYYEDSNNWYRENLNNRYSPKNLNIPDLSNYFESKEEAYRKAVDYDFGKGKGKEDGKRNAIMLYSYAASIGSKKALYTLINMAMEETEYFIDVKSVN